MEVASDNLPAKERGVAYPHEGVVRRVEVRRVMDGLRIGKQGT